MNGHRFLDAQRPTVDQGILQGQTDTTTLAAHDFDVDVRTGFMPPTPPLSSLPEQWSAWEDLLSRGLSANLLLNSEPSQVTQLSIDWHQSVESAPRLQISGLLSAEPILRRAHLVLAMIVHLYIHSHPTSWVPLIPQSVGLPLLQVSKELQLPPVLTYSDTVLYNWKLRNPKEPISETNIQMNTLASSTTDEAHFYLISALIELKGAEVLKLMRSSMNEAFIGDNTAVRRISANLLKLSSVIDELSSIFSTVKSGCDPNTFFFKIRPWLRGSDSSEGRPRWTFEDAEMRGFTPPSELSGPSAGQSTLLHALDIFLGIHKNTHVTTVSGQDKPFLERMKSYMPRHHRAFLDHLAKESQLRDLVERVNSPMLSSSYNEAIRHIKLFRDQHIRIVTQYIITPSRSQGASSQTGAGRGTGGSDIMPFLKNVRDKTLLTQLHSVSENEERSQIPKQDVRT